MMMTIMTAATSTSTATTTTSPRRSLINQRQQQQHNKNKNKKRSCFRSLRRSHLYWILVSICIVYLFGIQYSLNQIEHYHITDDDYVRSAEFKLWMSYLDISSLEDLFSLVINSSDSSDSSSSGSSGDQEEDFSSQKKQANYNDDDGLTKGGGGGGGGGGKTTRKKQEVVDEEQVGHNNEDGSSSSLEEDEDGINNNNDTNINNNPQPPPRFVAPDQLKLSKPIINVGFPKAGTSTIYDFFYCNGLKAQHWYCCENENNDNNNDNNNTNSDNVNNDESSSSGNNKLMSRCLLDNMAQLRNTNSSSQTKVKHIFDGCGNYDVYTEINGPRNFKVNRMRSLLDDGSLGDGFPRLFIPQHHYLNLIHDAFPNSTFILNLRPVQDWVTSVVNWPTQLQNELPREFYLQQQQHPNKFGYVYDPNYNNTTTKATKLTTRTKYKNGGGFLLMKNNILMNDTTLKETLEVLYNFHNDIVRKFVTKYPSHTLIEIDITNNNTGKILADTFGLNDTCWGHSNQNKHKNGKGRRKGKHRRYQNNKKQFFGFMQGMKRGPGGIMLNPDGDRDHDHDHFDHFDKLMEGIIAANYYNKNNNNSSNIVGINKNNNLELLTSVDRHQRSEEIRQKWYNKNKYLANGKQRQILGEKQKMKKNQFAQKFLDDAAAANTN